jgi:pyruvate/2-oxoglutarate/acetoin dehydrogenase E1 component
MPKKGYEYAYYEGLRQEMQRDPNVVYWYEYQDPVCTYGRLKPINLEKEFGRPRVNYSGIDENWYVAAAFGAARVGIRTVSILPNMAEAVAFHHLAEIPKMYCSGAADETFPIVIVQQTSDQGPGGGQTHSDYECDAWFMHVSGLKVVAPATAYDAKGLIISSIRTNDPVLYLMGGAMRLVSDEVPDEAYEVPIGKVNVRAEGKDITLVTHGQGVLECDKAVKKLTQEGVSVEYIDLRTLKPLDRKSLVESVRKTGKLLTVDPGYYTLSPGAEVVATCAEGVPGAKFKRLACPDTSPLSAPEFMSWLKPNAEQIAKAAKNLLKA